MAKGMKSTGNLIDTMRHPASQITQSAPRRIGGGEGKKPIEFEVRTLPTGEKRFVIYSQAGVEHLMSQKIDCYEAIKTGFYFPTKQSFYKKRKKIK